MNIPKLARMVLASSLVLLLASCVSIAPSDRSLSPLAPDVMGSPLPTAAPQETAVAPAPGETVAAVPASTFPTSVPTVSGPCVGLAELEAHVGTNVCIAATVLATENWGNDFVMWLNENPASQYIVVHNTFYLGVEGSCIRVTGVVQKDEEGRLFIRADDPGQVDRCTP